MIGDKDRYEKRGNGRGDERHMIGRKRGIIKRGSREMEEKGGKAQDRE